MRPWSHSRIETFGTCPRQYRYRCIEKVRLPEEPESVVAFLGRRVHETLERVDRRAMMGRPPEHGEALERYRELWRAEWSGGVVVVDTSMPAKDYRVLGERCVVDYHARHAPFDVTRTMALEEGLDSVLDSKRGVRMTGFIDRVARAADGTWQIHDYKTTLRFPSQAGKDQDPQLADYQIGLRERWPGAERVDLTWHFLSFGQAIVSRRTDDQLASVREAAPATIGDAEGRGRDEQAFETHESGFCVYCPDQALCPVWRHRRKVEELPGDEFRDEPVVELVDRRATLDARRRELAAQAGELEGKIDRVRDALLTLADREPLEVVAVSEHEVAIRRGERVLFPRKSAEPEQAAELEALLRGSRWWPEVSGLDRAAPERMWSEPRLEATLRGILQPFVTLETERSARLRQRRG